MELLKWCHHYEEIGRVTHTAPKLNVVGITLTANRLALGDRISFLCGDYFQEMDVQSMEIDKTKVDMATKEHMPGVQLTGFTGKISENAIVWRVRA